MRREQLEAVAERLGYLAGRWEDESEYEDWSEYEADIRRTIKANGGEYVSLRRRPMLLVFRSDGYRYEARVKSDVVSVRSFRVVESGGPRATINWYERDGESGPIWHGHMESAPVARAFTVAADARACPGALLRVIRWEDRTQPIDPEVCLAILDAVDAWEAKHGG